MAAIGRAASDGAGVLVASHDPAAVNVADRIIHFDL
jgi:ABC-type lipoprotein export system ATPase subunit